MSLEELNSEISSAITLAGSRLTALLEAQQIPGCSLAVVHDQQVIWSEGFGYANIEKKVAATPQTVYRVASITKLFTATMLMQLRDAGKLHLDDPIEKYLPQFKFRSPFSEIRPPSFRDVVSHMSGLPREAPLDYWQNNRFPTITEVIASLPKAELAFPPMYEFKYSNLGFALLGQALASIAGVSYRDYIVEHILQPLKMKRSDFELNKEMQGLFATAYLDPTDKSKIGTDRSGISGFIAAGQLYSTVADMASFISLQFRDEASAEANPVLRPSSLREMHAPVFINPGWKTGQGIGWAIERSGEYTVLGHLGSLPGFNTSLKLVPQLKLGVALFTNTLTNAGLLNRTVLETLIPSFDELRMRQEAELGKPLPENWPELVGSYTFTGVDRLVVEMLDGRLVGHYPKSPELETLFLPEATDLFRMKGGSVNGEMVSFERGADGKVKLVRLGDYFYYRDAS